MSEISRKENVYVVIVIKQQKYEANKTKSPILYRTFVILPYGHSVGENFHLINDIVFEMTQGVWLFLQ